jgi:hypothetical protein
MHGGRQMAEVEGGGSVSKFSADAGQLCEVPLFFFLELEILVDVIRSESRNPRCARSWPPVSLLVLSTRLGRLYVVVEQVYH